MGRPPRDTPGVRFPPPALYLAGILIGALMQHFTPTPSLPRDVQLPLGIGLVLLGVAIIVAGASTIIGGGSTINPAGTAKHLMTGGIYRFTRNPMYLGLAIVHVGVAAWANSLWILVLLPIVIVLMNVLVIQREEAHLTRRFGAEYDAYRQRTRRWL
jgi:protein-S-isoprenylcysteine O-methyltransferase Ste14